MVSRTSAGNVVFLGYALVAARRIAFSSVGSSKDQTLAKGHVLRYDTVLFALRKWFVDEWDYGREASLLVRAVGHAGLDSSVAVQMHGIGSTGFVACTW